MHFVRALVEPATRLGFTFEDDHLPDEMIAEVEGERGALPMLAFAVARLWDKRDRARHVLTRQAYDRHRRRQRRARASRRGDPRPRSVQTASSIVRELFRNLVTAEGTRAVREWDELLSIFGDSRSESPTAILRALIDARLLTSYEILEEEQVPTRRVEIVHESLLENWPRLVGWQTQDADSARMRDELRQAARTWDEHGRHPDRLWTGSAYREFTAWRERYPGALSDIEESYAWAMTTYAKRRRRLRRIAVAVFMVVAAAVTTATTVLWRRSVFQERRAEAQKLIALGQVQLEEYPTAALAYATRSLDLTDSKEARYLALEALWEGPTTFVVNEHPSVYASFSPGWAMACAIT